MLITIAAALSLPFLSLLPHPHAHSHAHAHAHAALLLHRCLGVGDFSFNSDSMYMEPAGPLWCLGIQICVLPSSFLSFCCGCVSMGNRSGDIVLAQDAAKREGRRMNCTPAQAAIKPFTNFSPSPLPLMCVAASLCVCRWPAFLRCLSFRFTHPRTHAHTHTRTHTLCMLALVVFYCCAHNHVRVPRCVPSLVALFILSACAVLCAPVRHLSLSLFFSFVLFVVLVLQQSLATGIHKATPHPTPPTPPAPPAPPG